MGLSLSSWGLLVTGPRFTTTWCDGRLLANRQNPGRRELARCTPPTRTASENSAAKPQCGLQLKSSREERAVEPASIEGRQDHRPKPKARRSSSRSRIRDGAARRSRHSRARNSVTRFFEFLYTDPRVKRNPEMRNLIVALEHGAETVSEIVDQTRLTEKRVYELRRQVKQVAEAALTSMNRDGDGYEQTLPKRSTTTA